MSDLVLGLVVGVVLVFFFSPLKGVLFILLDQKRQIAFLTHQNGEEEKPEETLAEKRS